jgi:hypothetical protein
MSDRFTIHEQRLSPWLHVVMGDEHEGIELVELVEIDDHWRPRDFGEESTVYHLVAEAQRGKAIVAPGDWSVSFLYQDDDGGGYQWLVTLEEQYPLLMLVSCFQEMRKLVFEDVSGRAAVESIVREAVQYANEVLDTLDRRVDSRRPDTVGLQRLLANAKQAAEGPSNDEEIEALNDALGGGAPPARRRGNRRRIPTRRAAAEVQRGRLAAVPGLRLRRLIDVEKGRWIIAGELAYSDADTGWVECRNCRTRIIIPDGVELDWR